MVNYGFKRSGFYIKEMIFSTYDDAKNEKCDVINMHSYDEDISQKDNKNCLIKYQYTLVNDLREDEVVLFGDISKNYRYEIRRAQKEESIVKMYSAKELEEDMLIVERFQKTYNSMFSAKNMSGYKFNINMIKAGIKNENIVISSCIAKDNPNLEVFHAYLCDGVSTMLLYSASPLWEEGDKATANLIGRMNKYLHWKDFLWFKNENYVRYEWGGIHSIERPNGIDKFKMEFGGEIKRYLNYTIANSFKGKLYIKLVEVRKNKRRGKISDRRENTKE